MEAVDRTGGRGDLPPAQDGSIHTPEALRQREDEPDKAWEAMLLWAMANPHERSNRLIAQAAGLNESNIRHWKRRHGWAVRCAQVPNCEYITLDLYRRRMEEHVGTEQADTMRAAMDVLLDSCGFAALRADIRRQRVGMGSRLDKKPPVKEDKPATAKNAAPAVEVSEVLPPKPKANGYASALPSNEVELVDEGRAQRDLAYRVKRDHLRSEDLRRQVLLIDAVLGLVAKRVKDGTLKVSVRDVPSLLKARALLTGLPTEHVAVQQQVQHEHHHVVESVRIQQARKTGSEAALVEAMRDEVDELQAILRAVPRSQETHQEEGEE